MKKIHIMLAAIIVVSTATGVAVASMGQGFMKTENHQVMLTQKAEMLGIEVAELESRMADGESLRDIFQKEGITKEDFVAQKQEWMKNKLDALLAKGKITQEQADEKLEWMQNRMENCPHEFDGSGRIGKGMIKPFSLE